MYFIAVWDGRAWGVGDSREFATADGNLGILHHPEFVTAEGRQQRLPIPFTFEEVDFSTALRVCRAGRPTWPLA